jgi:hypothetical protein
MKKEETAAGTNKDDNNIDYKPIDIHIDQHSCQHKQSKSEKEPRYDLLLFHLG